MPRDAEAIKIEPWAETGERIELDSSLLNPPLDRSVGWPASFSVLTGNTLRRIVWNQIFREITGLADEINKHGGILEWDAAIAYEHPAFTFGSNGNVYLSMRNSVGRNPALDTLGMDWRRVRLPTDAEMTKLMGIETGATADQTGSEIQTLLDGLLGTEWRQTPSTATGTITAVVAGAGLSGGGTSGSVTLAVQDPVTAADRTKLGGITALGADLTWRGNWANTGSTPYPAGSIVRHSTKTYIALVDRATGDTTNPSQDANWQQIDFTVGDATTSAKGLVELATAAEVQAGVPANVVVTAGTQQLPASVTLADRGKFVRRAAAGNGYELVDLEGQLIGDLKQYAGRLNLLLTEGFYRGVQSIGSSGVSITGALAKDYPIDTLYAANIIVLESRGRYTQIVIAPTARSRVLSTESAGPRIWVRTVNVPADPDLYSRWYEFQIIPPTVSTSAASGDAPDGAVWYRVSS